MSKPTQCAPRTGYDSTAPPSAAPLIVNKYDELRLGTPCPSGWAGSTKSTDFLAAPLDA